MCPIGYDIQPSEARRSVPGLCFLGGGVDTRGDETKPAVNRRHLKNSPFNVRREPVEVEQYTVGARVIHDSYGLGTVVALEGTHAVMVDFSPQRARISLPCSKMTAF